MFSLYLVRVLKTHKHVHPCTLVCPLFTADSTLDSAVSYRLWPPTHSTAIRRHSERCILLSNVHFRIVFTDANKIYFYSPQTSRREACKLSGGRAYGRCFAWIKYVCIRWECRLNIDHAGTTLYTTIFISRYDFRTWDKQGSRAYAAQHKGCRYNSATSKIVRRVLDPVLQTTR